MALSEIKGQERAVGLLKKRLAAGRLAHAYLFYGPEGIGKELTAKNFAKLLNCRSPSHGDACDFCEDCVAAEKHVHPDIIWLRPQGKGRVIPIGDPDNPKKGTVRHFQRTVSLKPYMGRWKVGIFTDAHALQRDAAGALLKTLEEPPAHTLLILVTSRPDMLLPTIISRCQAVRFEAMPQETLEGILRSEYSLARAEAGDLSRLMEGRLGEAVRALREERLGGTRELTARLADGDRGYWSTVAKLLSVIDSSVMRTEEAVEWELAEKGIRARRSEERTAAREEEGEDVEEQREAFAAGEVRRRQEELLKELLTWYRDLMVWKLTASGELLVGAGGAVRAARTAGGMNLSCIQESIQLIETALRSVRGNTDFRTAVENLLVQLVAMR
ncbi:MAG: DNA polymerase III subunit delta' [Candidatus Aureabacteria bacterium]|nr:DNA polymerase III subunit delta' [Candidatus Auribacterota bacterium]